MFILGQVVWDNSKMWKTGSESIGMFAGYEDDFAWVYNPYADDILVSEVEDIDFIYYKKKIFLGSYIGSTDKKLEEVFLGENEHSQKLQKYLLHIDDLINTDKDYTINK